MTTHLIQITGIQFVLFPVGGQEPFHRVRIVPLLRADAACFAGGVAWTSVNPTEDFAKGLKGLRAPSQGPQKPTVPGSPPHEFFKLPPGLGLVRGPSGLGHGVHHRSGPSRLGGYDQLVWIHDHVFPPLEFLGRTVQVLGRARIILAGRLQLVRVRSAFLGLGRFQLGLPVIFMSVHCDRRSYLVWQVGVERPRGCFGWGFGILFFRLGQIARNRGVLRSLRLGLLGRRHRGCYGRDVFAYVSAARELLPSLHPIRLENVPRHLLHGPPVGFVARGQTPFDVGECNKSPLQQIPRHTLLCLPTFHQPFGTVFRIPVASLIVEKLFQQILLFCGVLVELFPEPFCGLHWSPRRLDRCPVCSDIGGLLSH